MLVGVVAFKVLGVIEPTEPRALGVLLTGYIFQGAYSTRQPDHDAMVEITT